MAYRPWEASPANPDGYTDNYAMGYSAKAQYRLSHNQDDTHTSDAYSYHGHRTVSYLYQPHPDALPNMAAAHHTSIHEKSRLGAGGPPSSGNARQENESGLVSAHQNSSQSGVSTESVSYVYQPDLAGMQHGNFEKDATNGYPQPVSGLASTGGWGMATKTNGYEYRPPPGSWETRRTYHSEVTDGNLHNPFLPPPRQFAGDFPSQTSSTTTATPTSTWGKPLHEPTRAGFCKDHCADKLLPHTDFFLHMTKHGSVKPDLKRQNHLLCKVLFDDKGECLFHSDCILRAFGISKGRLRRLKGRQKELAPGELLQHGLCGRRSNNSKKPETLSQFIDFVKSRRVVDHYHPVKNRPIYRLSNDLRCIQGTDFSSLRVQFNLFQQMTHTEAAPRETISSGTAQAWFKKYFHDTLKPCEGKVNLSDSQGSSVADDGDGDGENEVDGEGEGDGEGEEEGERVREGDASERERGEGGAPSSYETGTFASSETSGVEAGAGFKSRGEHGNVGSGGVSRAGSGGGSGSAEGGGKRRAGGVEEVEALVGLAAAAAAAASVEYSYKSAKRFKPSSPELD